MSTLTEIEIAADSLSPEEKEELLRFLAMRLRKERPPRLAGAAPAACMGGESSPAPRIYSDDEVASMLAEDEADGERLRQSR